MERDRVTVQEAARRLGISESGVRKRVQRDQIDYTYEEDGRLYVYLDTSGPEADSVRDSARDGEIEALKAHIASLERQLEQQNMVMAAWAQTMRALSAPESPETPAEPEQDKEPPEDTGGPDTESSRPWWRRWFG